MSLATRSADALPITAARWPVTPAPDFADWTPPPAPPRPAPEPDADPADAEAGE